MHGVVMESLEEYLSGALAPVGCREVEAHLLSCADCREEVAGMQETSGLFGSLRTDETVEPSLGFYAGVMRQAKGKVQTPAFGGSFGLDLAFGRRLVFASLVTLAVLGGYLVARERQTFSAAPGGDGDRRGNLPGLRFGFRAGAGQDAGHAGSL